MSCKKNEYDVKEYKFVSNAINYVNDWRTWIRTKYIDPVAEDIIASIENGTFNEDYGKKTYRQIVSKTNAVTNAKDVASLRSFYATAWGRSDSGGFKQMQNEFIRQLVLRVLIDPETKEMIDGEAITSDGVSAVNKNLYDFKMELVEELWGILFKDRKLDKNYQNLGKYGFTKLLADTISEYERRVITGDSEIIKHWDSYFMLKFFDQLLVDFSDFVKIKPEYGQGSYKTNDMYTYTGPNVRYDTSFNPNEFASADQYASEFTKKILNYVFNEYNLDGTPSDKYITFEGFNRAICDLKDFLSLSTDRSLRLELYKGESADWNKMIRAYIADPKTDKESKRKLLGILEILGKDSIVDNKIQQVLRQQTNRVVRYEFIGFRKKWDPKLKQNVIVPIRLKDYKIDKVKGSVAKAIRYRVWDAHQQPKLYTKLINDLGIYYDGEDKSFVLKGYGLNNSDIYLYTHETVAAPGEKKLNAPYYFEFVDGEGNLVDSETVNETKVKKLVETLLQVPITSNYREILDADSFGTKTLFGVYKNALGLTLAAAQGNEFSKFTYRLNGNELELPGQLYYDLGLPAIFEALMNGIQSDTMSKNGLGNDLPNYQQKSAIYCAQQMLDLALHNSDGFRNTIWDATGTVHNIYENNILQTRDGQLSTLGKVIVRADYDAFGSNKNSAQMNFSELSYFNIFKSYWNNLENNGHVLLQTICLSDKHTHFLIEFLTENMNLLEKDSIGRNRALRDVLKDAGSGVKNIRDNATNLLLKEIRTRRAAKTRVELINLLNRYELGMFGRTITKFEDSYAVINQNINKLENELSNYKLDEIRRKVNSARADAFVEADLFELNGRIHINETLLHSFQMYCGTDDSLWKARIKKQQFLHAKDLFKSHFKIDTTLDPALYRQVKSWREEMLDFDKWYDERTGIIKAFRIFDASGNELIPNYSDQSIKDVFDSSKNTIIFNPILNSHFLADIFLSGQFNDIVFGETYGLENKWLSKRQKQIGKVKAELANVENQIANIDELLKTETNVSKINSLNFTRNIRVTKANELRQKITQLSTIDEDFLTFSEASRLSMHYKRTVHGGATFMPLEQNMQYGVSTKVRSAVINDLRVPVFGVAGNIDKFVSQDGAGIASPYYSRMANVSYVDGRVGDNKKTIFSYVDPETGILHLFKWAEFELTNYFRRSSPEDFKNSSYEIMFKKMHDELISHKVFTGFDVSEYFNSEIDYQHTHMSRLFYYNQSIGKHFEILNVKSNGAIWTRNIVEVDTFGNRIGDVFSDTKVIDSIYKMDQFFGGAYTEELTDTGVLDYSEVQNDIVHKIICDLNLKENFIGYCVNASAVKSGQRNNNERNVFTRGNTEKLQYFEMSTRYGGAQMNADHDLNESEVTEMSQMISALIQSGLRTRQVEKIYQFIGAVAKDALGDVVDMSVDPGKELELYKWLGEAVARSFQSGTTDTLGLAGAFIARANKNFQRNGLKTRIPFSANTVKGIFESAITSIINRQAIHRKFPGGGLVQIPAFDITPRYSFGDRTYDYSGFVEAIRKYNTINGTNFTPHFILNPIFSGEEGFNPNEAFDLNGSLASLPLVTNEFGIKDNFANPFIKKMDNISRHSLDEGDTVILYNTDEFGNIISSSIEIVELNDFITLDNIRNLTNKHVAHWSCRPKNLLGNRTKFDINGQSYSLWDLDSERASLYAEALLQGTEISTEALTFLENYRAKTGLFEKSLFEIDFNSEEGKDVLKVLKHWATKDLRNTLKRLSDIKRNGIGTIPAQVAFNAITENVPVINVNFNASQMLMGVLDADAFGVHTKADIEAVKADPVEFFRKQLSYLRPNNDPNLAKVSEDLYDGILHTRDGQTVLLIIGELRDKKTAKRGTVIDPRYTFGQDGNIYFGDENLGLAKSREFRTYRTNDGLEYQVLYADTMQEFEEFYRSSSLYTNFVPNANETNFKHVAKFVAGAFVDKTGKVFYKNVKGQTIEIQSAGILNSAVNIDQLLLIKKLAVKKAAAWRAHHKGIGTRIPAQSQQSCTPTEVVDWTPSEVTGAHIGNKLMWIQGSDVDIDKLFYMTYGFTEDGFLATFTDLEDYFDAEKCLDLAKPSGRNFKINILTADDGSHKIIRGRGIKLIQNILDQSDNEIFVLAEDVKTLSEDFYDPNEKVSLKHLLDVHEKSERSRRTAQLALRNVVVRGILNVLTDPISQYNLELPISMDDAKDAASNSVGGNEELYLCADNPSSKVKMQIQNMVGRDVIGIGAASLKAFFAASTYFNVQVTAIEDSILNGTATPQTIWERIRSVTFNSKFNTKRNDSGLIAYANINFTDLLNLIKNRPEYQTIFVTNLGLVDANSNLNNIRYINPVSGGYQIDLLTLVSDLDEAANGTWDSPIDAAFNLSELISAATDNAKELILAKINATSKFADIYTYLLSTGESFANIANFMTSPIFNIVAEYADGIIFDPTTKYFDLEKALAFVLDEETLPIVDNRIWLRLITSNLVDDYKGNAFLNNLLNGPLGVTFAEHLRKYEPTIYNGDGNTYNVLTRIHDIVSNGWDGDNYTVMYKNLVAGIYAWLKKSPEAVRELDAYLISRMNNAQVSYVVDYNFDEAYLQEEDYGDAIEESGMQRFYDNKPLSYEELRRYYKYLHEYLIPKNDALNSTNGDLSNLYQLRDKIIPALKEQRILSKILGVNQGIKTQDYEEYRWIRDIEAYVNERYLEHPELELSEFNLIEFLKDPEKRKKHIANYEKVKSTYNILEAIVKTPQFWEMLRLVYTDRVLIEKSLALKYERVIANTLLKVNKKIEGNLSRGLVQKLNDSEYSVVQKAIQDIITRNWFATLNGLRLYLPKDPNFEIQTYKNGVLQNWGESFIELSTSDGLASLKWLVENYVLPKLKSSEYFGTNAFIRGLRGTYTSNSDKTDGLKHITLPINLVNHSDNTEIEDQVTEYRNAFNTIYKKTLEEIGLPDWTVGDLFYLYNLYVFKDNFGNDALTRLFDDLILTDDSTLLVNDYYDYICRLDSRMEYIQELQELEKLSTGQLANFEKVEGVSDNTRSLVESLRLLMAQQTDSGYKFRVNIEEKDGKKYYVLLDQNYKEAKPKIPASEISSSDYRFILPDYNPIVLRQTPSQILKRRGLQKTRRKINGKEAVEVVVNNLQRAFGYSVPIYTIDDSWFDNEGKALSKKPAVRNAKGFIYNGIIYINLSNKDIDINTPMHELMHITCAALKYSDDPEQRALYYSLLNEIKNAKLSEKDTWLKKYYNQIFEKYQDYAVGSDLYEEVLVEVLADAFASGYFRALDPSRSLGRDSSIETTYRTFEGRVSQALASAFGIETTESLREILNMPLGKMLLDFNSELFNINGNVLLNYQIPINQKIATFKRKLVENADDPDATDYLKIGKNC